MTQNEILNRLLLLKDEKYADFSASLIPGLPRGRIIGVRLPKLRRLAAEISKSGCADEFLGALPHRFHEENLLHAFIIGQVKDFSVSLKLTGEFLPYIDNWAVCDSFFPKGLTANYEKLYEKIRLWAADEKPYTVRFAVGMLMRCFLDERFSPEHLTLVTNIRSGEYYVNMMRAWYIATALYKQWEPAAAVLESRALDKVTHAMAIRKACESRRITPEQKAYLKTLK